MEVRLQNLAVARVLLRLLKEFPEVSSIWEIAWSRRFRKVKEFVIHLAPGEGLEVFVKALGLEEPPRGIPPALVRRKCCRRSFLRGAFLASGSVNPPERSYHLEVVERNQARAGSLVILLQSLELPARISRRPHNICLYLKKADHIARALNLMGATQGLLRFEEVRSLKDTKNDVRRLVNAEAANLAKVTNAAVRQTELIRLLQQKVGIVRLPDGLREVARARLKYPEASLRELGARMTPPLTKSSVSNRLSHLEEMAVRLRDKGTM